MVAFFKDCFKVDKRGPVDYCIEFLRLNIDAINMVVSLPQEKVADQL